MKVKFLRNKSYIIVKFYKIIKIKFKNYVLCVSKNIKFFQFVIDIIYIKIVLQKNDIV